MPATLTLFARVESVRKLFVMSRDQILNILVVGALAVGAAFLLGRWTAQPFWVASDRQMEARLRAERFAEVWQEFVKENDGWIPSDPYRALIEGGQVGEYVAMRDLHFVRFLPPRVHPDQKENAKLPVFSVVVEEGVSAWVYHGDGSIEFFTWDSDPRPQPIDWPAVMRAAGFEEWKSVRERDEWVAKNKDRLEWDPQKRMFVKSAS